MLRTLLLVAAVALAATAPATADEWAKDHPLTGRPTLVLRVDDAHVSVTPGTDKAVHLHVVTTGWKIGGHGVHVASHQVGDRVECEVRDPRLNFVLGLDRHSVRVEVTLPRDADLDLVTGDGGVEVGAIHGAVHVHTGDGSVDVAGVRGVTRLETSDGQLRARDLDGTLAAHSSDGAVEVDGRFDGLDVSTSDGRVVVSARPGSRVATTGWSLHTGDGSVELRLPRDLRADLDLRTGDGAIHLDLPVETMGNLGRNQMHGRLNGGGGPILMRTSDGAIRVEPV